MTARKWGYGCFEFNVIYNSSLLNIKFEKHKTDIGNMCSLKQWEKDNRVQCNDNRAQSTLGIPGPVAKKTRFRFSENERQRLGNCKAA